MPYRDLEPVSKQLTIVVGLTVVGFMTFGLALSFYRNVLFERTLQNISVQNDRLREENTVSQRDLDYYRSVQFKDKYAKENLNKLTTGEKVLILIKEPPSLDPTPEEQLTIDDQQQAAYEELLRQMPVIEHWKLYLFHRDKLDTLKRSK